MQVPDDLKEVLAEKLEDGLAGPPPVETPRLVHGRTSLKGKATAVVGMRRAGKTTFVHQLRHERLSAGAAPADVPYLNFEDERLAGATAAALGFVLEEHRRRQPGRAPSGVTWSFDEIQLVPGWERFVRRLLDEGASHVVVTGSSAALLSREVATALRGRAWEVVLHPFSFAEALAHARVDVPDGGRTGPTASTRRRAVLENAFLSWLEVGGFPEAQGLDAASRFQLLRDYVDVAILRDVVERHSVTNVTALRWLVRHLLGNAAGSFSVEKFHAAAKSQGVAVSRDTVHSHLAQLQDCFLVRTVSIETDSERQRMVNPRKSYPVDAGLIPVFDRSGKRNVGHALETAVLIELERRRCAVTYVRTPDGREVDFFVRTADGREELVQVCADASAPATAERELSALEEAGKLHPRARRRLLTLTADSAPPSRPRGVVVQPAYEWMLAPADGP